jgi:hypothetical protein
MTSGNPRTRWRRRATRWLGFAAGALAVTIGGKPPPTKAATATDNAVATPAATRIPAAWQDFGRSLQRQIQARLASNSDAAVRFHDAMERLAAETKPSPSVLLRVWIMTDGTLERIEIDGLPSEEASRDLMTAVGGVDRPPSDMPQPVQLRLSLGANAPTENQR